MKQKVIVVTGCTRGLGRAMVDGFIKEGAIVVGCGRNAEAIDALKAKYGTPHLFAAVDVTENESVKQFAYAACDKVGAPDWLINNAALINRNNPLWEISHEEFSTLIDVNIKGVANMIRHFVPKMINKGSGVIVNFSSGWGRSTSPEVAPYCASKFAIEGLSQSLAQELPSGLTCVALNPGVIDTDMLRECLADGASGYQSPGEWAKRAVPRILKIASTDNGRSLDV